MKQQNTLQHALLTGILLILTIIISSCASPSKASKDSKSSKRKAKVTAVETLSPEAQRKYDYFFLEAARMKEKGDYDAAFELYKHCLQINPNAASALYEIAQFYLFLKQLETGLSCMIKAVEEAPDNFWYKQTLAAFYQSNRNVKKAIEVYEDMFEQFPGRQESLLALIDLYNRVKDYPNVIHTHLSDDG